MRAIRRADTAPERRLRSLLHARGLRFRKDQALDLGDGGRRVRPDIVFPRQRLAVFVDGCFWHRCPRHATSPRVNQDYWVPKLERNARRDRDTDLRLRAAGWSVLRLWAHVPAEEAAEAVVRGLEG